MWLPSLDSLGSAQSYKYSTARGELCSSERKAHALPVYIQRQTVSVCASREQLVSCVALETLSKSPGSPDGARKHSEASKYARLFLVSRSFALGKKQHQIDTGYPYPNSQIPCPEKGSIEKKTHGLAVFFFFKSIYFSLFLTCRFFNEVVAFWNTRAHTHTQRENRNHNKKS